MIRRAILAICVPIGIQACAVGNPRYPVNWDPLVPSASADCRRFEGSYADRGQTRDNLTARSLTRELFGYREEWKQAARVRFTLVGDDVLAVTVSGTDRELVTRNLHASTGDFACDQGRLIVRDRRWVAEDLVAGHERTTLELHHADGYLVANVNEFTLAVVFIVVPLVADATHWYRFQRLPN
jgi:hypothetical protein